MSHDALVSFAERRVISMKKVLKMIGKILGIILLVILVIGIIVYAFVLQYPKLKDDPKVGKSLYGYRWKGKDFVS